MTNDAKVTQTPIRLVSRIVSNGPKRKIIAIPAADMARVEDLKGRPVLVTLTPIL